MAIPSAPLFGNPTVVTEDVAIKASPGKIWAVLLAGGTTDSYIKFYDHISEASGTNVLSVVAPCTTETASGRSTVFVSFVELGGIDCAAGIWADWNGTGCVGHVWFS